MDHGVIYELFKHNETWENVLIVVLLLGAITR